MQQLKTHLGYVFGAKVVMVLHFVLALFVTLLTTIDLVAMEIYVNHGHVLAELEIDLMVP
jgi:hypothetical protein